MPIIKFDVGELWLVLPADNRIHTTVSLITGIMFRERTTALLSQLVENGVFFDAKHS